jgi:hypothetical protein
MGRIWRGLRLGLKSLMLHKLRSGLTALGLIFGVAAVISMLAVGEGASRDAQLRIEELGATNIILRSVKPSDEVQAASGRPAALILRYGLKYADFERIVGTVPTIKRVLPVREITSRSPGVAFSTGPTIPSTATAPCSRTRRPRPYFPTRTRSARRSAWGVTPTRSSA